MPAVQESEATKLHTETSSSLDRRFAAYFLKKHEVIVTSHEKSRTVQDQPFYYFRNDFGL